MCDTVCIVSRSFTMPTLTKFEFAIDFNEVWVIFVMTLLINWLVNVV